MRIFIFNLRAPPETSNIGIPKGAGTFLSTENNQAQRALGILAQGTALGRLRKHHSRLKACGRPAA